MDMPGEKLLIKLWESLVDKGIGNILKPWQQRREGRALIDIRRQEMIAIAHTDREVEAIRRGERVLTLDDERIYLPIPTEPPVQALDTSRSCETNAYIEDVAIRNAKVENVRREISIAKAVLHAEEELRNDTTPPTDERISDDWLLRWRDYAAGVSSEELQSIWGKVLAGEVKSPGRYSLPTLEFLRNLSQEEAKAIERISPFVVADVIFRGDSVLTSEGIKFGDLLVLQELGVLTGIESIGLQMEWDCKGSASFTKALTCHGKLLLVTDPDPNKVLGLRVCTVTAIGKQVLQLGSFQPNEKMLREMGEAIKAKGFEVQIGRYVLVSHNQLAPIELTPI